MDINRSVTAFDHIVDCLHDIRGSRGPRRLIVEVASSAGCRPVLGVLSEIGVKPFGEAVRTERLSLQRGEACSISVSTRKTAAIQHPVKNRRKKSSAVRGAGIAACEHFRARRTTIAGSDIGIGDIPSAQRCEHGKCNRLEESQFHCSSLPFVNAPPLHVAGRRLQRKPSFVIDIGRVVEPSL